VRHRYKTLLGIGSLLAAVSLSVNLYIAGAESEADSIAREQFAQLEQVGLVDTLKPETAPAQLIVNTNTNLANRGHSEWVLVLSSPPLARPNTPAEDSQFRAPLRTPTFVKIGQREELTLSTKFRQGRFSKSTLESEVVEIPLRPHYLILTNLLWPGLGLVLLSLFLHRSKQSPKSLENRESSSLDTVVNAAPPAPPAGLYEHDPRTPEELIYGRFIRGELLGKGAMGQVYKCTSCQKGDSNIYALKILLPQWSKSEDFRARFKREADICRKLAHPNLVRAYEYGEKNERLWMVMDYVEGVELDQWLEQSKPSEKTIARMCEDLCDGLEYAHELGVIHRDLKPGNILIKNSNGRPVIADFGLARGKHYETITKTNSTLGTPTYMPPEQITGGKGSAQGDLYSLGCILYQALSGNPPFDEEDVMKLLTRKLTEDAPPPLGETAASPDFRYLVDKLLRKKPEERYQSARELKEAIASFN